MGKIIDDIDITPILEKLITKSYVSSFCSDMDYISINSIVQDVIQRSKIQIESKYSDNIKKLSFDYIVADNDITYDISEYFISMQELLRAGKDLPANYIIPSHYVKTIIRLYNEDKKYNDIINLAKKVLEKKYSLVMKQNKI